MTKNEIIGELFTSKEFISCIKKMEPVSLQDDLKSEVILVLLEKDDDLIHGLHQRNELKYYTVRIILNMIQSKSSPFYKTFRKNEVLNLNGFESYHQDIFSYSESVADSERNTGTILKVNRTIAIGSDYDTKPDEAMLELENLYWYDREIMKLYAEHGTFRKIEEVTQIPWESVYKTVRKSCQIIRKKIA